VRPFRVLTPLFFANPRLNKAMLKAIIFDCDGVIADTEPIHMATFQRVLVEEGITLGQEQYFREYLGLDDRACFTKAFAERGDSLPLDRLNELIKRKADYVEAEMRSGLKLLPGAAEFIQEAGARYPLAVASGALRREIDLVLKSGRLQDCFRAIVSSEDVARSKPDPAPFIRALHLLNLSLIGRIEPRECLVIEDSIHGIEAAQRAGMPCLAVTNSYPSHKLSNAERVIDSLTGFHLSDAEHFLA
jgi:beta-phosphoglucomutase